MFETARYLLPALLHLPIYHYEDYVIYLEVKQVICLHDVIFLDVEIHLLRPIGFVPT